MHTNWKEAYLFCGFRKSFVLVSVPVNVELILSVRL